MIRAVLFDLDGTLLDRRQSLEQFIYDQYNRFLIVLNKHRKIRVLFSISCTR